MPPNPWSLVAAEPPRCGSAPTHPKQPRWPCSGGPACAFTVAEKGIGFVAAADQHAFLATTGKPERKAGNDPGTPRPIRVTKRHGDTDLATLTKQVYWLSEAHVASISRSTRLPITTADADRCADHARTGSLRHDERIRGVPYV